MLKINRQLLLSVIKDILPATLSRTVTPILSNVLVSGDGNFATFTATNLEYRISILVEVEECNVPDFVIDARVMQSWLLNQVEKIVNIDVKDGHIVLQSGKSKTKVNILSADDYPKSMVRPGRTMKVDPFAFANALSQTVISASMAANEARVYTRGVYFQLQHHKMLFTAMNGFTMAHRVLPTEFDQDCNVGVIPSRCISPFVKLLNESNSDVELVFEPNTFVSAKFDTEKYKDVNFQTQLLNVEVYPNYDKVIPKLYDLCMVLDKNDFIRSINGAMLFANELHNRINFEPDSNGLYIRTDATQTGEHEDYLQGISVIGAISNSFVLNGSYLLGYLRSVNTDKIQIECRNGFKSHVVLRDADIPDAGLIIITPMYLKNE